MEQETVFSHLSIDKIVRNSIENNKIPAFNSGNRVVKRIYIEKNQRTRVRGLNEHYYFDTYTIISISFDNIVTLMRDAYEEIIKGISTRDLIKIDD